MMADADDNDDDIDSDSSEEEDDLADVPDTREYTPLDLEGLQAMGIGGKLPGKGLGGEEGYTLEDLQNMTMNNNELDEDDDDDEEEEDEDYLDDIKIRDQDALILVAKAEEDFASLEINVFDTEYNNLYVHHDIPLPSFPLCLALGSVVSSYQPNENNGIATGNYVAIGSFEPGIEIWNLDVMNALEPTLVLGGMDTRGSEEEWMRMQLPVSTSANDGGKKTKKKKKKKKNGTAGGLREGSHTDAVMSLSWNTVHQQVLASGSADGTVKLWDVTHTTSGKNGDYVRPSATLTHHSDKVQSLAWHPSEGTLLATGGYDRKVCLVDARSNDSQSVKTAKLLADCEAIAWDPHNQQYLTVASEDGVVQCWDVRKFGGDPVWSMIAHEYGGVSDISYNTHVPGMLITCSIDKTVALWDTLNPSSKPTPCGSKDMNVGRLHSVSCYPSSPWLLACGGSGNEIAIWDMEGEDSIQKRFAGRTSGDADVSTSKNEAEEPDFEAIMASGDDEATRKAIDGMNKSKKKKGKKGKKVHKRK
jgi:periodic tryptophan protein 1